MIPLTRVWFGLSWLLLLRTLMAEPPKVVQAVPDNGPKAVDPNLKELRIVFDQPMSRGGWSIVGGGPTFPKLLGNGHWADDRTLVWAWRLEPEHDYWLSINSARFTNFRSTNGEPAVPHSIAFRTGKRIDDNADVTPGDSLSAALNREAVAHLRRAINEDYSYRDLRKVDWEARFAEFTPKLEEAKTSGEFAEQVAQMLAPARDIHLWLQASNEKVPTFRRQAAWNIATSRLPQLLPRWEKRSSAVFIGMFEDGIRYLCIRSWPGDAPQELEPAYEVLVAASNAGKPLILDVRANVGGSEDVARQMAGCFIDRPVLYAKHVIRSGGNFSETMHRVLEPNKNRPPYSGRVAVLIGLGTVSSCESFAMMMKQVPGCALIGERTAGASGNPRPVDLGNGVTLFVPRWKDLRLDGTCLEGEGFAPDIAVNVSASDFAHRDPVIEEALRLLRNGL